MKLEKNIRYKVTTLSFSGWYNPDNVCVAGYTADDYFDFTGCYQGPDNFGVEPEFEDTPLYIVIASVGSVIQDSPEYLGEYWGVHFGSLEVAKEVLKNLQDNVEEYNLHLKTVYEITET